MTDITEPAQREKFEAWARSQKLGLSYGDCGYVFSSTEMAWRAWMTSSAELVEALEEAQGAATQQGNIACALLDEVTQLRRHADEKAPELRALLIEADSELEVLRQRIAELEREHENLRPVGVMSEKAYHRLENRESRFIALWPRPEIYLPRKRPEDGVIVYARTAATTGIKWEAE